VSTGCAKFAAVFEFVQDWASKRKVNYIMTHSNAQGSLVDPTAEIRFPGIAVFLFIIAPFLLFFGFLTFMGASTRNYFDGAPFQSSLGLVMFLTGVLTLLSALVLTAINAIVGRHTKVLLVAQRAIYEEIYE